MFGQSNAKPSLFGTSTNASAFGQPNTTFGTTPSVMPFGAAPQQSMFGTSNQFGATTSGSGLFGTSQPTSLFGNPTSTVSTGNTFGQTNTNAFSSSSGSLFGSGAQQNASLFGSRFATTGTSPFGGTATLGAAQMTPPNGSTIKFNPVTGTDSMMKNGVSTTINTRHQCITCMKEYEMKSLEEIRLEDYLANRKGPQNMFGNSNTSGLFGTPAAPQTNTFGQSNSLFGQSKPFGQTTTAATTSGSLFNAFNKQSSGSLFGNTTNTFSSIPAQNPQTSLFGNSSTSGALNQPNFFSNTTSTATVKPFSFSNTTQTQPQQQSLFATNTSSNAGIGGAKPLFGTNTNTGPFGTSTTAFNTPASGTLFSTSQPSFFSGGASSLQQPKPAFNFTSQPQLTLNPTLGTNPTQTGGGLFGGTLNTGFGTNTGTSLFGQQNTGSSLFGQNLSLTTPSLQSNTGLMPMTTLSQTPTNEQLLTRFQTLPYGDSPLFQIDSSSISEGKDNSTSKTKFTTDPKTLFQYKMNAKSVEKPQRIANGPNRATTLLFDGLEDEKSDNFKTAQDIFVPRRNIKRLVLKPKDVSIENISFESPHNTIDNLRSLRSRHSLEESFANTDNTMNDLYTSNKTKPKDTVQNANYKSPNNANISIASSSSTKFSDSSINEIIDIEGDSIAKEYIPPKCGVILARPDYYTIPTIEQMDSLYDPSTDTCFIDSLTVGRHNYGSIYWDGPFDIKGLNLDEIIHIRRKEAIVYPDDDSKPKNGESLNRPAQITLHQVWPIDKTTHEVIKDLERLRSMKYAEKVESATLRLNAQFKEYRPDTGSWVFNVKHFSKYGMTEDDEEMEDANDTTQSERIVESKELSVESKLPPKRPEMTKILHQNENERLYDNLKVSMKPHELSDEISDYGYGWEYNEKDDDDLEDIDDDKLYEYESQREFQLSEKDIMKSVLFDDMEVGDDEMEKKRIKKPKLTLVNMEKMVPSHFFSPIVSQPLKIRVPKKRILNLKPDVFAAENRNIKDICSVCVSQSQKIRFFKGSNKFTMIKDGTVIICDLKSINTSPVGVFNARFDEQLKNNSLITNSSHRNFTVPPYIETREFSKNSQNPKVLEELIEALYGNLSETAQYARHRERLSNIQRWLYSCNKKLRLSDKSTQNILHFLSTNELEAAVNEALNSNQPRMAYLIACGTNINKDLMIAQLDSWKKSGADKYIDDDVIKIYILLSGQIKWCLSTNKEINILSGLTWTQQLSLMLLYSTPPETYYEAMGVNILQANLSQLTVSPDDVEYHLLAFHTPLVSMSASTDILESWFLHESLKSYHVIVNGDEFSTYNDSVHCSLISQLTDIRWACFVALHIRNDMIREMILKDILTQNAKTLDEDEDVVNWLKNNLLIVNEYIAEAKSLRAKSMFDYSKYALNLLECGQWSDSHDVFMENVFPDLVIKEEHNVLSQLLSQLKPHAKHIPQWFSNGGFIYETFLKCINEETYENIESFNVHQLKCNTKRHVLCQSEMTRKANEIYSTVSGGTFAYNTPIPDDYALFELKINAKKLAKSLC